MIASFSPGFVRELILSDNTIVETALFEQQRKDQAAHALTEQRNEAMREAVKGLFVMNGGGSVALLAFLQAISKEHEALAKYLVFGITPMIVGVVLAGLVHFFRYHTSWAVQTTPSRIAFRSSYWRFRTLYISFAYASLFLFVVGMTIVLRGVWKEYILK